MNMMEAAASEPSLDLDNLKLLEVRLCCDCWLARLLLVLLKSQELVVHTSNSSSQEAEARGFPQVPGQPGLCSKFQGNFIVPGIFIARPV